MTILRINTRAGAEFQAYTQRTALDGKDYVLSFQWNQREAFWYLDLLTLDEEPIALGRKIVHFYPLLKDIRHPERPPGELICLDLTDAERDPGLMSMGVTHDLFYYDAAELGR